jgi:hypothetical protein
MTALMGIAAVLLAGTVVPAPTAIVAQGDEVVVTAPAANDEIFGTVEVVGTVNPSAGIQGYFVEITSDIEDLDNAQWTPVTLPGRDPVQDDVIATVDTTAFSDGVYALRLTLVRSDFTTEYAVVSPVLIANSGEAAQAAQPAATEDPNAVVPRPDVENTLPVPVGGQMDVLDPEVAELMAETGMTWMKFQIRWTRGDFSLLTVARDRINFAHENGFRILLSIPGVASELAAGGEQYLAEYAQFVGEVARLGPEAIQIWNEQNIDREWPAGQISGANYVDLLRPAYISIKAVDESVMVITGAPAPTGFFGGCGAGGCDDDVYYSQMAQAGAAEFADCIGVHYNEGILPPTAQGGDPRGEYPTRYLPLMIQRAGFPFRSSDIGLCFSEIGYLSGDGYGQLPAPFAWAANTSVQDQAEWLRDAITVAAQSDYRVELMIVFNINFDRFVEDDPQGGFAIIRPDGSCPACETIASLRSST